MKSFSVQPLVDLMSKAPSILLFSAKYALVLLLPSFIRQHVDPSRSQPTAKLHPTSWLDGLRGIAALIVLWYHIYMINLRLILPDYGHPLAKNGAPAPSSIIQLPFLRVLISGRPMVHIFFIVSGYALSLKSLKQVRSHDIAGGLATISSATFRRGLRLFLPIAASTLLGGALLYFRIRGGVGYSPTLSGQFDQWLSLVRKLLDFWAPNGSASWVQKDWLTYEPHTWTIPLEMTNSLILFLAMIALSRCRVIVRLLLVLVAVHYCMQAGQWVATEFLLGMFLAEFGLIRDQLDEYLTTLISAPFSRDGEGSTLLPPVEEHEPKFQVYLHDELERDEESSCLQEVSIQPITERHSVTIEHDSLPLLPQHRMRRRQFEVAWMIGKLVADAFSIINLLFGLYVFGWPELWADQSPNFKYMIDHAPAPYNNKGNAVFPWYVLAACQQLTFMQYFLTLSPIRYLGRISYSLYLMHWSVFQIMQSLVFPPLFRMCGTLDAKGVLSLTSEMVMVVWATSLLAITPVAIWVADLFCTAVDDNSVKFARWFEAKCLRKDL